MVFLSSFGTLIVNIISGFANESTKKKIKINIHNLKR